MRLFLSLAVIALLTADAQAFGRRGNRGSCGATTGCSTGGCGASYSSYSSYGNSAATYGYPATSYGYPARGTTISYPNSGCNTCGPCNIGGNSTVIIPSQNPPIISENPNKPQVIEKPESTANPNTLYIMDPNTRQLRPATAEEIKRAAETPQRREK